MIKKNLRFLNAMNMVLDIIVILVSLCAASVFWLNIIKHDRNIPFWTESAGMLAALSYALLFWIILSLFGMYNSDRRFRLVRKLVMIVGADTLTVICVGSVLFLIKLQDFSWGVLSFMYLFSAGSLCAKYTVMRLVSNYMRAHGKNQKHVLIIGTGDTARRYEEDVCGNPYLAYRLIGYVGEAEPGLEDKILCGFDGLEELLRGIDPDDAVIALNASEMERITEIILTCEKNGIRYSMIPFYSELLPPRSEIDRIGQNTLINFRRNLLENYGASIIKRSFDIVASVVGLVVLSPLMLAIAIGVKSSSPGPVLFRQERVGYNRKTFRMLKFRSMQVNASQDTAWTKDADSRRTRFGSFIRKYSLDELPQLWNVLRGDMSLIGPRPELPHFVNIFRETVPLYMVKHQVRPGITGWAQVNGYRGDTSIEKRIEYDIWYIENWSFWLDIKILFMTLFGGMKNNELL